MKANLKEEESLQKMQLIAYKEILSLKEALLYLDVSKQTLYQLTSKKKIKFTKPNGGKIYFRKEDLDKWMLQNESDSARVLEDNILNHLKQNAR